MQPTNLSTLASSLVLSLTEVDVSPPKEEYLLAVDVRQRLTTEKEMLCVVTRTTLVDSFCCPHICELVSMYSNLLLWWSP